MFFSCLNLPLRGTSEHEQHLCGLLKVSRRLPGHTASGSVNRGIIISYLLHFHNSDQENKMGEASILVISMMTITSQTLVARHYGKQYSL